MGMGKYLSLVIFLFLDKEKKVVKKSVKWQPASSSVLSSTTISSDNCYFYLGRKKQSYIYVADQLYLTIPEYNALQLSTGFCLMNMLATDQCVVNARQKLILDVAAPFKWHASVIRRELQLKDNEIHRLRQTINGMQPVLVSRKIKRIQRRDD